MQQQSDVKAHTAVQRTAVDGYGNSLDWRITPDNRSDGKPMEGFANPNAMSLRAMTSLAMVNIALTLH